jgi:RNA polymerase sigma-32 factor
LPYLKLLGKLSIVSKRTKKAKKVSAEIVDDSFPQPIIETDLEVEFEADSTTTDTGKSKATTTALTTTDAITQYMAEIRKYPLLTKEQEQELAIKYYETKDPLAAQALVTANLRFVVKIAAEYSKFGARMIDLVQEGNMGLMHGVRDFNPYKGVRLITYAVWWIRGYIQEYLMKQYSMVKIGTTHNQKKLFYQLQKHQRELAALGIPIDIKQLSSKLDIPEDEVREMTQRMSGRDLSLDTPLDDESRGTLKDLQRATVAGPDEELSHNEEITILKNKIAKLRPELNEREIILLEERLLADEPLTLQEVGEKYGITREAVRQAEVRLMNKIKELYKNE